MDEKEKILLENVRLWLKNGATIRATDINKPILAILADGSVYSGCTVTYPVNLEGIPKLTVDGIDA